MHSRYLGLAALACNAAFAFRDASPFALFSTSRLPTHPEVGPHVASPEQVFGYIAAAVQDCSSDSYVLVRQPGVAAADLQQPTPHFKKWLSGHDKSIRTSAHVANVVGLPERIEDLDELVRRSCHTELIRVDATKGEIPNHGSIPQTILVDLPGLPLHPEDRAVALRQHDSYLHALITSLPNDKYTVIYTTTPRATVSEWGVQQPEQYYEMDEPYPSGMHTDLKRDVFVHARASNSSSNLQSNLGLFEKYQFLSSGIFMGGTVALLLLVILYMGISALAGLEVSYGAFSKEMGPAAQKKQSS